MNSGINAYGLPRYISAETKLRVRQACGHGCVICGSAIYQYEHIDPPFREAKEHNPENIALLCGSCHDKVTRGYWSKDKVAEARQTPYCRQEGFSHFSLDLSSDLVVVVGANSFYGLEKIIEVNNETLLAIHPPESPGTPPRITARFFDEDGNPIARIVDNEWQGSAEVFDIESTGGRFKIRSQIREINLELQILPRNVIRIDVLDFSYAGVRITGGTATGFLVQLDGASVRIPERATEFHSAPFWLSIQGKQIRVGGDNVIRYKGPEGDVKDLSGFYAIEGADVEDVDPLDEGIGLPPGAQPGQTVKKVTTRSEHGGIAISFDLPRPTKMISKDLHNRRKYGRKIQRNELCPCGSGRKYKQCCGKGGGVWIEDQPID